MAYRRSLVPDAYPTPLDSERRSLFIRRFSADRDVKRAYETPAKRAMAAERVWAQAKARSLVSITTSADQFLLFD